MECREREYFNENDTYLFDDGMKEFESKTG